MGRNRILCEILRINEDTNDLSGDVSDIPKSHRILDVVRDIKEDTGTIVETGGGGGTGVDAPECTDDDIDSLFE